MKDASLGPPEQTWRVQAEPLGHSLDCAHSCGNDTPGRSEHDWGRQRGTLARLPDAFAPSHSQHTSPASQLLELLQPVPASWSVYPAVLPVTTSQPARSAPIVTAANVQARRI
jgi:hypothetical protein